MPRWSDPDVTPVGWAPAPAAQHAPAGSSPAEDPFGSRPTRRAPGWFRVALGAALVAGGLAAGAYGIADAVGQSASITEDAVGRGTVRAELPAEPLAFTAAERGEYTVYLLFAGRVSREPEQSLAVRDTACTAALPNGRQKSFTGARQGVASTVGQASSVGRFETGAGRVSVRCAYKPGTRSSARIRPDEVAYVVTPGGPDATSVLTIVAGVFAAIGGGFLVAWGWRRRRPISRA